MNKTHLMLSAFIISPVLLITGCSVHKTKTIRIENRNMPIEAVPIETTGGLMDSKPVSAVAMATVFRMDDQYSDNVAIGLSPDGTITYYPAPTDLSEESKPLPIADGWWLNRQGFGANAVFTKFTFAEYMALKEAPTPAELKEAVIQGSGITAFKQLPITMSEALSLPPSALSEYL